MSTKHVGNWKAPDLVNKGGIKTVCNLRRSVDNIAAQLRQVTCDTCILRVLREGQELGLNIEQISNWTWKDLQCPIDFSDASWFVTKSHDLPPGSVDPNAEV
jgi:hypothetical protein